METTYNHALRLLRNSEPINYDSSVPRYLLYSAHDTQIANLLWNFAPNYNFTSIPYAASFVMELKLDRECASGRTGQSQYLERCLGVGIKYDGKYINMQDGHLFPDSSLAYDPASPPTDEDQLAYDRKVDSNFIYTLKKFTE